MDPMMLLQLLGGNQNNFGKAGAAGSLLGMGMGKGDNKLTFGQNGVGTKGEAMNMAIGQGLASGLSTANNFANINNSDMNLNQKQMMRADAGVNAVADTASMFGPIGSTIGAGLKAINTVGGMLIKTPEAVKNFNVNEQIGTSSGFGGVVAQADDVTASSGTFGSSGLAGKLTGKKRLLNSITQSNNLQSKASGVLDQSKLAQNSALASADMFSAKNQSKLYNTSTWNNGSVMMGSQGGTLAVSGSNDTKTHFNKLGKAVKMLDLKKITKNVKKTKEGSKLPEVPQFKDGGAINVIVDGALHAHKHTLKEHEHLEDADITLKGIPVVSHAEGGEVTQHAEVERDELILHYDLTKKLEDLYEEGDLEAMIQAGRILSKEIVKNTKDSKSKIIKNSNG